MLRVWSNFIDGKWVRSSSGKTFKSYNPAKPSQTLGIFQQSNEQDVERAVSAAEKAFLFWSDVPAPGRARVLFKIRDLLTKNKQRLGKLVTTEMGKVFAEGLGDVQEAIDVFEYMAGEGRRLFGHTTPSELRDKFCMTVRQPIGIIGLITPWNFPIAIPAWKMSAALICGNTVVFKPSSDTPLCAAELVKLMNKAGVPPGVVNMVTGPGENVGGTIIKHPKIHGISFTGHKDTGNYILKNAGIKKVGLELGGKNAIIIMDDANLDLALEGVLWGAFGTTGQRCTATSRVIIHRAVQHRFEQMLLERVHKLQLGSGLSKDTDVGPLINQAAVDKSHKYVQIGKTEGATLLCGGGRPRMKGCYYNPTVFTNVTPTMRIANEEIFGPVLSLIPVNDLNEAIEVANGVEYGLSASIYTQDINKAFKAIKRIESGVMYVNASTIGAEVHLPFGGVKNTGNGTREAGIEGIHEFSEVKTVYVDFSGKLQKAQIDVMKVLK
ncbi:aldehyde dehydrogenase family protein [Candidatus Woesearchaeota archaeon]|nr:aldehyde dehydrogenase family protein [Candidatus Woesearchaeota archaeon]